MEEIQGECSAMRVYVKKYGICVRDYRTSDLLYIGGVPRAERFIQSLLVGGKGSSFVAMWQCFKEACTDV